LRALAVTSSKRLPLLPEVPTLAESGYRNFQASEWKVLLAPAGTPPSVVERINKEVQKALAQPAIIARVLADGSLPMTGSVPTTEQFVKAELTRWSAAVRESGLSKTN
jgi:tripartite-type tricarboxylate transporter receptor subunit TctC